MDQFGSHDMCLEWNRATCKSILDAEKEARLHSLKLQALELEKNMNTIKVIKVVYNILHTIMLESIVSETTRYLTINKLYAECLFFGHKHLS